MESRCEAELLSAFVDEALDPPRRLLVEQRIDTDAVLRAEVQALRLLRSTIRVHAQRYGAPACLATRVREAGARGARERAVLVAIEWRRWFEWRPLAMALSVAGLAVWGLNLFLWQPRYTEHVMQAAISRHLQATSGQRLVDYASADRRKLEPWLATRLSFAAPVALPDPAQVALVGGRIDNLEGRSVAALVYRLREHIVDAFIWPTSDDDTPISTASLRGFNVSHWSRAGLRYCVVSDLPRSQLVSFAVELERNGEEP
jgi:anti-sigma factor RsiW